MLELQSASSLSSKKSQLSSTLKSQNNSTSTISTSEIQRSPSLQSSQLTSKLYVVLSDISKSSLLSSENLKQLERSKSNAIKNSHRELKSLKRRSSVSSIFSEASSQSSSSLSSSFRKFSRTNRRLRRKRLKAPLNNGNYGQRPRRKLRKRTEIDTRCSLSLSQQRQSIINRYISTRSNNINDTFSLDRLTSIIDSDDDETLINPHPKPNLPLKNNGENLHLNNKDDNKSQTSSVLFALLSSPPVSPLKFDFTNITVDKKDVCGQEPKNDGNDDTSPCTSSDNKLGIDEDSTTGTERKNPRLILKITKDRLKCNKKGKKNRKHRSGKKRSRSALPVNKNEYTVGSVELSNGIINNNEIESISTCSNIPERLTEDSIKNSTELLAGNIPNKFEPAPETTINTSTKEELPKNINNNDSDHVSRHLRPKLRFHSKTQALKLGLFEKNQRIIKERKGIPPAKKKVGKAAGSAKPKRKNVKKAVQGVNKRLPGRPRKKKNTPVVIENIPDDVPYVEYEDGRMLPSLPVIDNASRNKSEAADNDEMDSEVSTSTKENYYPTAFEKFTKEIGIEDKADNCNAGVGECVAEITYCTDNINGDGKNEKKLNQFFVQYKNPLTNKSNTGAIKPPETPQHIEHRLFGESKPNLKKRIPRIPKKAPVIVEDKILPRGTVNIESLNGSVEVEQRDVVKKTSSAVDKKRKSLFAPEVAKKRKLLHSSEFNPPDESELNSFGIRSTVPSRQSLLPTKKISTEELYKKLSIAFREWIKIPEISEMLNANSSDETVKPKTSIKHRLGSFVKDDDVTDDKENDGNTSINAPKTIEVSEKIPTSSENIPGPTKSTRSIENPPQKINYNETTPRIESKVQPPSETTRHNTFERVPTSTKLPQKRSLDENNSTKFHEDLKRNRQSRWKREYNDDSDSSSSSESRITTGVYSSVNKFEVKSITSQSSSIKSSKSITQRLTEWSKTGTEVTSLETQVDDNSNCHSPSSVKTVVNASEHNIDNSVSPLIKDKDDEFTGKLDNNENVTANSSDNDDNDNDDSSSSSSSSCASSCTNATANSLIITSGCVEEKAESINNDLNAEEENMKDLSCVSDNVVSNDEERNDDDDDAISLCAPTMDDLVLDDNDLQSLRGDESFYSASSLRPYKRMKSANIGRFVSENVREFDAIYNNNENNIDDTNNNIFGVPPKFNGSRWEPLPPDNNNSYNNSFFDLNQQQQFNFQQPIATTSRNQARINNVNINNNNVDTLIDMKCKFKGHCFSVLKRGNCANVTCKFEHTVKSKLSFLHMDNPKEIKTTLIYAITERFFHYLKLVYDNSIKKLDAMEITEVFSTILALNFPNIIRDYINPTLLAFSSRSKKIHQFVDYISNNVQQSTSTHNDNIPLLLIDSLTKYIDDGMSWEILRNLILKLAFPTQQIIEKVLNECTQYHKSNQHICDIETNIIKRLDENILMKIDTKVIGKFNKLVDDLKNLGTVGTTRIQNNSNIVEEEEREFVDTSSIASPDTTTINNNNNNNNYKYNSDIDNGAGREGNLSRGISTDLRSRLGVKKVDTSLQWKLIEVENVSEPCSVYKSAMWLFHKDFELLKESLLRKNYEAVARTLEITKRSFTLSKNKIAHAKNFYRILCETVLETPEHLEKIILITVHNGTATAPDYLQMLLNVGINILKKLIHIEAWICAHRVLKVLLHYYGGTINVCNCYNNVTTASFVLLTVEIYIANRRPLKAFHLIKQNNLMSKDRNEWRVSSEDEDEELRVLILNLLLKSLCIEHVEHAYCMYTTILKDQNNNFTPLDLSRCTDSVVLGLIRCGGDEELIKMIDLMLKYHFAASPMIIRAAVVRIFHLDQVLSQQLHKYALEIRIYPQIQRSLSALSFVLPVDMHWTEEEMFLMMQEYLQVLKKKFRSVGRKIRARELNLYLNFEVYPSWRQLYNDNINEVDNLVLIVKAKKAMKNVLARFDPVIKFQMRSQDQRLCKFVNYTVINYLKAHDVDD